jgi:hypothetical protein
VAEEALKVLLTSGGTIRWKRKRDRAARLRPVAEDAASTTQLFNGNGRARRGRVHDSTSAGPTPAAVPANGSTPLLRYEWRSAAGETLVVEAGWPTPDRPEAEPIVTSPVAPQVTVTEVPIVVDHPPRLDLRN